jgi:antibiotic biosynthesis monooxygenase (ABM) superfamily enzyme
VSPSASCGPSADGATVVTTLKVRSRCDAEYRRWQEAVNDAARRFAGFEGAELYPSRPGERDEWVVIFRFSQVDQLTAWLNSTTRQELLAEGSSLFEGQPTEEVLAGGSSVPHAQDVVTAVVSHRVKPGREQDFIPWQEKFLNAQEKAPGYMGSEMFRPVPGIQDNWVVIFRFDTREHLDEWLESEPRKKLLREGEPYIFSYDVQKIRSAFSGWFRFDEDAQEGAPPNWKQAMSVLLALYPTVMALNLTAGNWLTVAKVPGYLALFIGNLLSVAVLTWILMPLVNRALAFWLVPDKARPVLTGVAGAALVVVCLAIFILIFALATG